MQNRSRNSNVPLYRKKSTHSAGEPNIHANRPIIQYYESFAQAPCAHVTLFIWKVVPETVDALIQNTRVITVADVQHPVYSTNIFDATTREEQLQPVDMSDNLAGLMYGQSQPHILGPNDLTESDVESKSRCCDTDNGLVEQWSPMGTIRAP